MTTTVLIAGLLGLAGTVVGGALSTWTARLTADRSYRRAREEQQRQEYRSAVIRFAAAVGVHRTAEMDRWHARHSGRNDDASASTEVHRTRTAMWNAFYELDLSTDNRDLVQLARQAIARARGIEDPDSRVEMERRADLVHEDLARLIATARSGEVSDSWLEVGLVGS